MLSDQVSQKPVPEWAATFPVPQSNPPTIDPEELAELIRTKQGGKDFLVVDVRRTDFEVTNHHILILNEAVTARSYETAFIRTAINLPAHSFYQTLPSLLPLLQSIPIVIFHCNSCSPGGRGPRTAAWYQDALDIQGIKSSHAVILASGVKGWIARYEEDTNLTVKLT